MGLEARQRLRLTFAKGEEIKYISHLDMMRLWERVLRRAQVPLAYSKGYNPRPKLALAAPLPVGFTSRGEVMDIILSHRTSPYSFAKQVAPQLPPGLEILSVEEVYLALPSLQSQVCYSEYEVIVSSGELLAEMRERLERVLRAESLPWSREREGKAREFDMRPLIDALWLKGRRDGDYVLGMRLQTDSQATGRPDEVLEATGLAGAVKSIQRTRLIFRFDKSEGS